MRRSVGVKLAMVLLLIALVPGAIAFFLGSAVLRSSLESASASTLATADDAIVASLEREARALAEAFGEQIANPLIADDFATMKRIAEDLRDVEHVERAQVVSAEGL